MGSGFMCMSRRKERQSYLISVSFSADCKFILTEVEGATAKLPVTVHNPPHAETWAMSVFIRNLRISYSPRA